MYSSLGNHTVLNLNGYNTDVDAAAAETVWNSDGHPSFPASPRQITIASSSANDDDGNTGVQELDVWFINRHKHLVRETVTMDGTTDVALTQHGYRVIKMNATKVGSNNSAVGIITATQGGGILNIIALGQNGVRSAFATIPLGVKGFIGGWHISHTQGSTIENTYSLQVKAMSSENAWRDIDTMYLSANQSLALSHMYEWPLEIPSEHDVRMLVDTDTNNTVVSASFLMALDPRII